MRALPIVHSSLFAGLLIILGLTVAGNFDYGHGLGNLALFYLNIGLVVIHFFILILFWRKLQEWIAFSVTTLSLLSFGFIYLLYAFFAS